MHVALPPACAGQALDAATPILALLLLPAARAAPLALLVAPHTLLHCFYVARWCDERCAFVSTIVDWSAAGSQAERWRQHGPSWFAFNTLGTCFDIAVHLAVACSCARTGGLALSSDLHTA